ncbi:MAG: RNA methyltransferase [Acidobacteriota bacterium]
MDRLSSRQNPIVKRFRDLARGRAGDGWVLLDGEHLIREAQASGARVEVAAFCGPVDADLLPPLAVELERAGSRVIAVTEPVLAAMSPVREPSGVVAIAALGSTPLADAIAARRGSHPQLVLMLSDVQDPGNVGAIIRAAEGCGASAVVAGDGSADPFGWKALRGAMGSTFRLPVAARASLPTAVRLAQEQGLRVFATVARGGRPLPECDLRGSMAILLGGEGAGLSQDLIEMADERLSIPMEAPVESLNVAVAAALTVYEAARQRRATVRDGDERL